ncbi:hypothetical protein PHABIO_158 [Pseudomonas phage Phabio]|uniref:Uncharacterized protein n=1 Tax=Pseudomonas phage Phabio TaxID=2006668 RepID=A0A1Y0SZ50_9CAUD|nr:hypothetical protein MZD05_gp158 [Pseudomonas phage Phabio]ARV76789.1 hypothetical protein PHABIO_158 [Pseudomonas phage Phabio]
MKAIVLVLIGAVLGGMFFNEKLSTPKATDEKTEIVYGTRIGPDGNIHLVVSR